VAVQKRLVWKKGAVNALAAAPVAARKVPPLRHKALDDAVEFGALEAHPRPDAVARAARERHIVGHRFGQLRPKQAHNEAAGGLPANGDVEVDGFRHGRRRRGRQRRRGLRAAAAAAGNRVAARAKHHPQRRRAEANVDERVDELPAGGLGRRAAAAPAVGGGGGVVRRRAEGGRAAGNARPVGGAEARQAGAAA